MINNKDIHCKKYYDPNDGHLKSKFWVVYGYEQDLLHRLDGPAIIDYYKSGAIKKEQWFINGEIHREDGPAWIQYNPDGSVKDVRWFLDDTIYDFDGWLEDSPSTPDRLIELKLLYG